VVALYHKNGSPFHELSHKQVYSVAEYEANTSEGGFFETYGGDGIDHEVIWDVREHEDEEIEAPAPIEKKKGRPFQKVAEVTG
jgi:hypothetical protein